MTALLSVHNLHVGFGHDPHANEVVRGVSFELAAGDFVPTGFQSPGFKKQRKLIRGCLAAQYADSTHETPFQSFGPRSSSELRSS